MRGWKAINNGMADERERKKNENLIAFELKVEKKKINDKFPPARIALIS